MGISSFNMDTSSANSSAHMKRDSYVSYLIDYSNNRFEYKYYLDSKEYLEFARHQTKLLTGRKMQSSAIDSFVQEAVINIEEHHTIEDIENLFKNLNRKFDGGFKLFDVAIHKDEGVFIQTKHNVNDLTFNSKTLKIYKDDIDVTNDVISFAPNKDIFYNPDNKKWYKEKAFKNEFDTSKLQIKYNLHAHANFTKWEESTGKNIRTLKGEMRKIQDITAECLEMQRGEINSNTKRMNHYQLKKLYSDNNELKKVNIELLATIQELKEANAELRAELKENGAIREDYSKLEALNRDLKLSVKNRDLTIEAMNAKFSELKNKLLKEKNEALESAKSTNISHEEEKTAYRQSIEELKKEITKKDDLIFGMKINYGKLEKEKVNFIERNESLEKNIFIKLQQNEKLEKEKEHLEAVVELRNIEISDLKSQNEMKPKEVEVEKIVEVKVENPINTQLQVDISDYRRMLKEATDNKNEKINTLQEEKEKLEKRNHRLNAGIKEAIEKFAKIINIPVVNNFSFFDSVINHFKALQDQIRVLTTKDTTSEEKNDSRPSMSDYEQSIRNENTDEQEKEAIEILFRKRRDDYK
jgi:hypothetical protein